MENGSYEVFLCIHRQLIHSNFSYPVDITTAMAPQDKDDITIKKSISKIMYIPTYYTLQSHKPSAHRLIFPLLVPALCH